VEARPRHSPPPRPRRAASRHPHRPAGQHRQGLQAGLGGQGHRRPHRLLDPDATATADGGGLAGAVLRPVEGGEQVARGFVDVADRVPGLTILERAVNGQPGLVVQQDGVTVAVIAFDVVGERIKHIWAVRNPEKLRPWTTG
jgi:hypothetical protein